MGLIKCIKGLFKEQPTYFIHRIPDTDNYFSYRIVKIFKMYEVIEEYRLNGEIFNNSESFQYEYDAYCYVKNSIKRKLQIMKEANETEKNDNPQIEKVMIKRRERYPLNGMPCCEICGVPQNPKYSPNHLEWCKYFLRKGK
jgi:hypothetical protein